MHLTSIEIQGFKTFANKTIIKLPEPSKAKKAITVIVGPNGSGKSNLTDAIRWCLGEQSMKQLRGKKSEDIIFSGATGKNRSGFAEVTLTFDNTDQKFNLEFAEITITRRVYREGNSEYLLNQKQTRLQDIQLLLAEAGIGQRTYTVIGQGMIDHILTSSPEERKIFFDDATGVRGFQIKRHQAFLKLERSHNHLLDIERLVQEIKPRLKLLKKQADRLKEREDVEKELKEIQTLYFGFSKQDLARQFSIAQNNQHALQTKIEKIEKEVSDGDLRLNELEKTLKEKNSSAEKDRTEKREAHHQALQVLRNAERQKFEAERAIEIAKISAQNKWSPLPLPQIIDELKNIEEKHKSALKSLKSAQKLEDIKIIIDRIEENQENIQTLKKRLTKPQPDDFEPNHDLLNKLSEAKKAVEKAQETVKDKEAQIYDRREQKISQTDEIFKVQRQIRSSQQELHRLEQQLHQVDIDIARLETRQQNIVQEITEQFIGELSDLEKEFSEPNENLEILRTRMHRLQHKRDLIGSIDHDILQEYEETQERFNFLESQSTDIREAIKATTKLIDKLDSRIHEEGSKTFDKINKAFNEYFKLLFGGGKAELIQLTEETDESENDTALTRALEAVAEEANEENKKSLIKSKKPQISGIDIQATPPGKNIKGLNLLSGGEKALTSIALLSAILATNPSPFIVLDEVDAALDEANTLRFAQILNQLQEKTQFLVITHNRATMEQADILYGVTMGGDGISNIISVKLQDISENETSRR